MIFQAPKAPAIVTSPMSMEDFVAYRLSVEMYNSRIKWLNFCLLLFLFLVFIIIAIIAIGAPYPDVTPAKIVFILVILSVFSIAVSFWAGLSVITKNDLYYYEEAGAEEIMAMMPNDADEQEAYRELLIAQSGRLLHGQAKALKEAYRQHGAKKRLGLFMDQEG